MTLSIDKIKKLENRDRINQIVEFLHALILDQNLAPGTELPSEKELAQKLGVSRFSLREALRIAETQGLIKISQGKRPVVTSPSSQTISHIMRIALKRTKQNLLDLAIARAGLECKIVRIAAEKITPKELVLLEENLKLMEIPNRKLDYYVQKDVEFHEIILHSTGSMVFEIILSSVTPLIFEMISQTHTSGGVERALNLHKEIFQALKEHDPDKAEYLMERHLQNAIEDILAAKSSE
ncbi:MAG: FadR/GntR family transcriptional regulator [Spirochaetales bacterium]